MKRKQPCPGGFSALYLLLVLGIIFVAGSLYYLYKIRSSEEGIILSNHIVYSGIVVDRHSVELFDDIPDEYITAAKSLRMLFIDRSVGGNINDGLTCLSYPSVSSAPNHCKRPDPVTAEFTPDSKFDRSNWHYLYWDTSMNCGEWYDKIKCFMDMVTPVLGNYDVVSYQNSYLEVSSGSTIDDDVVGYFGDNRYDIRDLEAFEAQHFNKVFIHWTTSLARTIGTPDSERFNNQMRQYALANNKILFDVADILSHDPQGNPCYDVNDDGVNYLAICPDYTTETLGGHLGSHSAGKIRVAKAFWVLMAQIAGWEPGTSGGDGGGGTTPSNTAPVVNAGGDLTATVNTSVSLNGSVSDDGLPNNTLTIAWSKASGPGTVTFANSTSAFTTATFSAEGTYTLRLQASDGELSAEDTVNITVSSPTSDGGSSDASVYLNFDSADSAGDCSTCRNYNTVFVSSGYRGGAYDFNGTSSYVDIGNLNVIDGKSSFTLSVWIKPRFDETSETFQFAFSNGNAGNLMYIGSGGYWRGLIRLPSGNIRVDAAGVNWDPDTWHMLTLSYNGSQAKIYWDGQLKGTVSATGQVASYTGSAFVGTSTIKNNFFYGKVDELRIYDTALTDSEVALLYSQ